MNPANNSAYEEYARTAGAPIIRQPDANVAGAGFTKLRKAFDTALISGLRNPKLTVGDYRFAPAKGMSKNPGYVYVTRQREGQLFAPYLGKIDTNGKFFAHIECTSADRLAIEKIGADPLAAAVLHGKQTGNCSCCGRHLENEESVKLGIGPICRAKWGL